jgi:hypothetical protein
VPVLLLLLLLHIFGNPARSDVRAESRSRITNALYRNVRNPSPFRSIPPCMAFHYSSIDLSLPAAVLMLAAARRPFCAAFKSALVCARRDAT